MLIYRPVIAMFRSYFKIHNAMEVIGEPPSGGPYIFVANHCSNIDPFLLASALPYPIRSLGKKELFHGITGWFVSQLGCISVDRDKKGLAGVALRRCAALIRRGESLQLFPEGHRSKDGRMAQFTEGFAMLSLMTGAPIVPVYLAGTYEALPSGSGHPTRHMLQVIFNAPVRPEGKKRHELAEEVEIILRSYASHHTEGAIGCSLH